MSGGVTKSLSKSLVAIMIDGGAHHLDLRYNNEYDPQSVIKTRELEVHYIKQWIKQAAFDWKWKEDFLTTKWTIFVCCVPKLVVSSWYLKLFYWGVDGKFFFFWVCVSQEFCHYNFTFVAV